MGRPSKYKVEYCVRLLEMMGEGKSVMQFSAEVGISRDTFYRWVKEKEEFSDAFTRAKVQCEAYWETKVQAAMFNREANAPLMKFYLANRFGWSDKQSVDNTSSDNSFKPMTLAELYGRMSETDVAA